MISSYKMSTPPNYKKGEDTLADVQSKENKPRKFRNNL